MKREGWGGLAVSIEEHPDSGERVIFVRVGDPDKGPPSLGFALRPADADWLIAELTRQRGEL